MDSNIDPEIVKEALKDYNADTLFGGLSDAGKIYEVRVFGPDGKYKKTIFTKELLIREKEIDEKKRSFNAALRS